MSANRFFRPAALCLCLVVVFGSAVCAGAPASGPATQPVVWSAEPAAQYLRLVQDLADPSTEGRGPGTAGIGKARDYIVQHFKDAGLEPAFGKSFTQSFPVRLDMTVQNQSLAVRGTKGDEPFQAKPAQDFSAFGFSPDANFRGQAVWVGYGISRPQSAYDSYDEANQDTLGGKVAIAFRYEPQDAAGKSLWARGEANQPWSSSAGLIEKARWAAAHGAVALLIVYPPSQDTDKATATPTATATATKLPGGEVPSIRAGLRIPVIQITSDVFARILRQAGWDANDAAIRKLQEQADRAAGRPEPLGQADIQGMVSLRPQTVTAQNVAGVVRGAGELADEIVVIGAHYDHLGYGPFGSRTGERAIHPGADDNASGSAGVMTLAKEFARRAADPNAPKSRRTFLFATFSGEERGLIGSAYLVRNLSDAGIKPQQIVAMLNMDMIGRLRGGRLYVMSVDSGAEWRDILKAAAEGSGLTVLPSPGDFDDSDHGSFYRFLKVPVAHFFTGLHAEYHTPKDTADLINAPGAVQVMQVVANVAEYLWTRPARLTYVVSKSPAPPGAAGPSAYLGIVPGAGSETEKGLPIQAVLPDGPADEAGLKPGDVILQINGKAIDKFKDLLDALGSAAPGDKVKLTIQRDGKTVEAEAKLGKRGG